MTNWKIEISRTVAAGLWLLAVTVQAGRYEAYTQKVAAGEKYRCVAATFYGGTGAEEFLDAGQLADGTIVAFGNTRGGDLPTTPAPGVLGRQAARSTTNDPTGLLVFYGAQLETIQRVIRFEWGLASITAGVVGRDGNSLFVAGTCREDFRRLAASARTLQLEAPPASGKKSKTPPAPPGGVYLARLTPTGDRVVWAWIFDGAGQPPTQLWTDQAGALYADVRGLVRVAPDGAKADRLTTVPSSGTAGYLGIDPRDGSAFFGGDRNTHTGRQPWRQPYLYKFDPAGKKVQTLWEWPPRECACGGNGNGLCSDSSPRALDVLPDGDLLVSVWSDGGNTVCSRQPTNWRNSGPAAGLGFEASGMKGANSLSHLLRIDGRTWELKAYNIWVAYCPQNFLAPRYRGAPNFTSVRQVRALARGDLAIAGRAATGLIQTPGAFWQDPGAGEKFGGEFAAVFSADFRHLLFSSYLPGCEAVALAPAKTGVIVVSRSKGRDDKGNLSPTVQPLQKDCRGASDGHILLLTP
jgi:hypothetical protein